MAGNRACIASLFDTAARLSPVSVRIHAVVLRCADPARTCQFWAAVLRTEPEMHPKGWRIPLSKVADKPVFLGFEKNEEPNNSSVLIELLTGDLTPQMELAHLLRCGAEATGKDRVPEERAVMVDPEGRQITVAIDDDALTFMRLMEKIIGD
jgi:catechol 2,3-dioxygenase-like lactoylglutathione lyase family enzyme